MDGRLLGGRYRLLESHAMGGMASVWRATDERTGQVVAIKRLHPHLAADPDARERLLREAESMEAIRHPNVVRVRDALVDEDGPAVVMDMVDGRSVAELSADGRRFDEPEALAVAAAAADGLAAAHDRGIIHRDVKPANVLIGSDGVTRLSDFGIAVGLDDASALTEDGGVIGTLQYLAPERLAGEPAEPATDVWGVGAVLYEMLTGATAFGASTVEGRVEAASEPVARPDGIADATWSVVAKSLERDPRDRYADAGALASALHALPGVPQPATVPPDPSAPTEVVSLPAMAAAATALDTSTTGEMAAPEAPEDVPAQKETSFPAREVASGVFSPSSRVLRRGAAMAALVGALVLALVVALAAGADSPTDRGGSGDALPSPSTATPSPAEGPAETVSNAETPGSGNGKGKGKGKGNSNKP